MVSVMDMGRYGSRIVISKHDMGKRRRRNWFRFSAIDYYVPPKMTLESLAVFPRVSHYAVCAHPAT